MSNQTENQKNIEYYCALYKRAFESACGELQDTRRQQTCEEIRKEFLDKAKEALEVEKK